MNPLRIAVQSNMAIDYITESMATLGLAFEILRSENPRTALMQGDIDTYVTSLADAETDLTVVNTALSPRSDTSFTLLVTPSANDDAQLFRIRAGATVLCLQDLHAAQLCHYRKDLKTTIVSLDVLLSATQNADCEAILLPTRYVAAANLAQFDSIKFNPKELIDKAGTGIWTWQTLATDVATRRLLKPIHQSLVSECTNVERQIAKHLLSQNTESYGVYCDCNAYKYYNVNVARCNKDTGEVKNIHFSNSTTFNLADDVIAMLD